MKWICYCLMLSGFVGVAQNPSNMPTAAQAKMETTALPEIVIKRAGEDFSVYIREPNNPDPKVRNLQEAFVAYDLGKDYEGFEQYLVTMRNKDASLVATYNEKGKLVSVVEKYDDVRLPTAVIYAVYRAFPGWQMVKDKYFYTQESGDVKKNQYNIKLTKGKDSKRIVVSSKGEIVESL